MTAGSLSLIIDQSEMSFLTDVMDLAVYTNESSWRSIHLTAGSSGLGECAVSRVSEVLAESMIPICYLSTSDDDYILVKSVHIEEAIAILKQKLL
jgi:hypothetical protein